ncbi:MAG: aldehyde ferredoxin oxidoreductase family protein [Chloroflexi bacterium]|nr:aldehyde ferredoxin oxidoreductase family protein [Chloroflexota bacterium]
MAHGSTGKILHVNLTTSAIHTEDIDEALYRLYPGGKALAAYLLLKQMPAHADPLGPDNVLILANGVLTGAPVSTATRFSAVARSPLTGAFGESEAGGFWGPELKFAGFEAIVLKGRADKPVYLWIKDGRVEIRDAAHLWGKETGDTQNAVRAELGDKLVRFLQIGPGGENLVRFACLTNDLRHYNGRNGMGAVMGSKRLKGIAVRGSGKYLDLAEQPKALSEFGKLLSKRVKNQPQSFDLQEKGTPGITGGLNAAGILPTRNFLQGAFEGVDGLKWEVYEKELLTARRSCYACAVRCKREVAVNDRYVVSDTYGGPEYEAVGGFGSNCGIGDLQAVAKANELCGRYTLDAISTSSVISFAMECFEHGLITTKDTGGMELRFGNVDAMLKTVELIAFRKGIGDLLAEGVKRAAEKIGGDAPFFAMHVKGQELPMHDPRGKIGVGIGYAVNEGGADHLVAYHDTALANPASAGFKSATALGITEAVPPRELSARKAFNYAILENWSSAGKVTGYCYFGPGPRSFIEAQEVVDSVRAATGWDLTIADLLKIGERATNLARVFNVREGFSRKDDMIPERLFAPSPVGALQGVGISHDEFEQALTELYRLKGWDPETAKPTRERLRELGIEWAADIVEASA